MKKRFPVLFVSLLALVGCADKRPAALKYPPAAKADVVETLHGTLVSDPYRWLEDDTSAETKAWGAAQNALTDGYMASLPYRQAVESALARLSDFTTITVPVRRGSRLFYQRTEPGRDHPVVCMAEGAGTEARVIMDRNDSGPDEAVALFPPSFSPDGRLMAYTTQRIEEGFSRIRIRKINEGLDYEDVLERVFLPEVAWTPDGGGFFYSAVDKPAEGVQDSFFLRSRVLHHRVGTPQAEDRDVFSNPNLLNPIYFPAVTGDGAYLIVTAEEANQSSNRVYYRPLNGNAGFIPLFDRKGEEYHFIGNSGKELYFQTTVGAPNGRVIAVDVSHPEREAWKEMVPEDKEAVLSLSLSFTPGVKLIHGQFVAIYEHNGHQRIRLFNLDGSFDREIGLPAMGTVAALTTGGLSGEARGDEMFFSFESFVHPPTIYRYDFRTHELSIFARAKVAFDPAAYVTEQAFAPSKDGTRIPLFVTRRKDMALDGQNPALIYAYGGFSMSLPPTFTFPLTPIPLLAWLEKGGIYVQPNLRGGGEFGEAWHRAGMLGNKQNVFDDLYAVAEWLVAQRYTSPKKLAILGQSNGGLLTAVALNQRPDLFGAVLSKVPVTDMLRYNLAGGGPFWVPEYGDPGDPEHFRSLLAYSPLHNIRKGTAFPPVLIQTGEGDTNVPPFHAKKLAAALQAEDSGNGPVYLRIQEKAAHGGTTPRSVVVKEYSEYLCFLFDQLGVKVE